MIDALKASWAQAERRGPLVGLFILSFLTLSLFLFNLPGAGLLTIPSFGLAVLALVLPWGVVLGKIRGVALYINSVLNLAIIFYYSLHGSIAIGLDDKLVGFRFTLISIQLYLFIITAFYTKIRLEAKKVRENLSIANEDEYAKTQANRFRRILVRIYSWIDALLDAAIMVVLINIFVFQLYVVPSESMVPTLLVGDRPFVVKLLDGPKLPVTNFGLPRLREPDRGDIVVVRNPRYDQGPAAEAKKLLSDIVYMLTFTGVLLDRYDDQGFEKADPLVKRLVGVPGETIEMASQTIYVRSGPEEDFRELEVYNNAQLPDLYALPADILPLVQEFPIDTRTRAILDRIDGLVASNSLQGDFPRAFEAGQAELEDLALAIQMASGRLEVEKIQASFVTEARNTAARMLDLVKGGIESPFRRLETYASDQVLALALALEPQLLESFQDFLLSAQGYQGSSRYYQQTSRLNQLIKADLGRLVLSNYGLLGAESSINSGERRQITQSLQEYQLYLRYFNLRNFPPYPSESEVIPQGRYMFIGDNRLNSLDARHGDYREASLDLHDPQSFIFITNIEATSVGSEALIGQTSLRLFPFSRFGMFN